MGIRVEHQSDIESRVPAWGFLPDVTVADDCVFMTNEIPVVGGVPASDSVDAFVAQLARVLATDYFSGKLGPIVSIPLVPRDKERLLLCAYMRSTKTREELNAIFGTTPFVPEGDIGREL